MHFFWVFVCLVLICGHCTFCQFSQFAYFFFDLRWYWCDQKFLLWLYACLVFHNPFPQLVAWQSVFCIQLHQIAHNAPENLWVVLWVSPPVYQIHGYSLVECKCLQVVKPLRVFQNSSCNYCQSDRKNLWPLVFLIVTGSKLELCNIFWRQKSHFLINWLLVIGVLIGVRVQRSNFHLSIKVNECIFRSDITDSVANFTDFVSGANQTVQQIPKIRFPEPLLLLLSVWDLFGEKVREVLVVDLRSSEKFTYTFPEWEQRPDLL